VVSADSMGRMASFCTVGNYDFPPSPFPSSPLTPRPPPPPSFSLSISLHLCLSLSLLLPFSLFLSPSPLSPSLPLPVIRTRSGSRPSGPSSLARHSMRSWLIFLWIQLHFPARTPYPLIPSPFKGFSLWLGYLHPGEVGGVGGDAGHRDRVRGRPFWTEMRRNVFAPRVTNLWNSEGWDRSTLNL